MESRITKALKISESVGYSLSDLRTMYHIRFGIDVVLARLLNEHLVPAEKPKHEAFLTWVDEFCAAEAKLQMSEATAAKRQSLLSMAKSAIFEALRSLGSEHGIKVSVVRSVQN
jgi:hypothetical protein